MASHNPVWSIALAGLTLLSSTTAFAGPSAAVFGGIGLPSREDGEDLFRVGFGARAGYTMLVPVYLGAAATFHTGSADNEPDVDNNHLSLYGLEAGLNLGVGGLGARPYVHGGVANVTTSRDVDGGFLSPYFGLGLAPYWKFVDTPVLDLFLGIDVRYVRVTRLVNNGDNEYAVTAVPLYAHVGASF